jgi:hypothetical protein
MYSTAYLLYDTDPAVPRAIDDLATFTPSFFFDKLLLYLTSGGTGSLGWMDWRSSASEYGSIDCFCT